MTTLYDLDRQGFGEMLSDQPKYRVDQVWHGLYTTFTPVEEISNLPKTLREQLSSDLPTSLTLEAELEGDNGRTIKWLWRLADGAQVETVLMFYPDRATICVSSQAGCAMACGFCATGQAGFDRNLSVGEIVEQVVRAARRAAPTRVSNIVFMGMGEPLANPRNTWTAVERIHGDIGLSARSITVSTVGLVPGIRQLAQYDLPVTLAVSLHAANDRLRNELVPINRRFPLDDLMEAVEIYRAAKRRRVSFEWAMIDGVNDRDSDADELARLTRRTRAHVNLIPLNTTPGYATRGTPKRRIYQFRDRLEEAGVNVTVRNTRGADIDAACGQLAARSNDTNDTNVSITVNPERSKDPDLSKDPDMSKDPDLSKDPAEA